ncbi:nSTAND1 domain-containing NTPase [Nostoc spongiaeforme]|nr:PQQ-binding-like beta-propeller repeat protein [Nostoc spongiaeforme]
MKQEFPSSQQNISNVSIGDSNVVTFNQTQILQISVAEIKTRQFIQTSPYKGLKKFEPSDKDLFFGRDQFLTGLVNELEQTNLILLLGASGSGKSSVVRAGLIPWLLQKWGSRLVNLTFTPDIDPFESFYANLLNKYKQTEAQIAREAKVDTLNQVVERLKQPDDYWLILIDQFEELFTTSLADKREQFIKSLVKLSKTKQSSVKIIGTMRADFFDRLSPYPQLVKATEKHCPFIAEMQPDELRLAIEQPAAHQGVVFETGLVEEIIKDVQGQAGYLPLLQYTLNLLWETEVRTGSIDDRTLNLSIYRQLGGVRGALKLHIDSIYDNLSEVEKLSTRKIFLRLVDIGENSEVGSEWKPVRRRALKSEFSDELEQTVLAKLIDENLLVSDRQPQSQESTIEISHEILLTSWTTLNTWIADNRHTIALRNRLNDDVANWQAKKADDELWSGSKLEKVVELRKDTTFNQVLGGFSDAAKQFIDASVGLRDRQRRRTILGLSGFSVVVSILALATLWQWQQTKILQTNTEFGRLIAISKTLLASGKQEQALIQSIKTGKQLQQTATGVKADTRIQVIATLQQAVYETNTAIKTFKDVNSASFSPDGQLLATTSDDQTVKLWDINTGKILKTLNDVNVARSVSFSPNGQLLATLSNNDKTVKLWDINTGKILKTLNDADVVRSVSFSPDGKTLATGANDNTVKLWDITSSRILKTLKGHIGVVIDVSFSRDGRMLASASYDDTVKLWDTATGKELKTFNGPPKGYTEQSVTCVKFSPDGKKLAIGSDYNTITLWDTITGIRLQTFDKTSSYGYGVTSVDFSLDGEQLISANRDKTVKLWNIRTSEQLKTLYGHLGGVNSTSFSPNSKLILSVSDDKTAKLWNINGKEFKTLKNHDSVYGTVAGFSFSPDGKTIATTGGSDDIKLWDATTGSELKTIKEGYNSFINISFSPDSKTIAAVSFQGLVILWDIKSGSKLKTIKESGAKSINFSPDGKLIALESYNTMKILDVNTGQKITEYSIKTLKNLSDFSYNDFSYTFSRVSFSHDSKTLAIAIGDRTNLLDTTTGKEIKTFIGHLGNINSVSFSPDGKMLVTASNDNTAKLWNTTTGREIMTLTGHLYGVTSVSFSPDGKTLATASRDWTVKLWDTTTGKQIKTFKEFSSRVLSISFSPDGKSIALLPADDTVKLLDANSGTILTTLKGHSIRTVRNVNSTSFSPDGKTLATGSNDGTVKLWDTTSGKVLKAFEGVISFSPNGRTLASTGGDGTIRLWEVTTGREFKTLKEDSKLNSISFVADSKTLATGSDDGTVKLWDTTSGKVLKTFKVDSSKIIFSPNGKTLASGTTSDNSTMTLWDIGTGKVIKRLEKFKQPVQFSPDSKILVSVSSDDGTLELLDANTGRTLQTLNGSSEAKTVSFSSDSKTLASADEKGRVKLWDITTGKEVAKIEVNFSQGVSISYSPDGKQIAVARGEETVVLNFDLEDLLHLGCDSIGDYLKSSPIVTKEDKHLCDSIISGK